MHVYLKLYLCRHQIISVIKSRSSQLGHGNLACEGFIYGLPDSVCLMRKIKSIFAQNNF